MINNKIKPQILLSTLWVFILFNTIFRDLHEFLRVGYIEEMMAMKMSEENMLFFGFIVELPILMILFSRILNNNVNKWVNLVVGSITMLGILSTIPSADMDDIFFAIIELMALVVILLTAWKLPHCS